MNQESSDDDATNYANFENEYFIKVIDDPDSIYLFSEVSCIAFIFVQMLYLQQFQKFEIGIAFVPIMAYTIYRILVINWFNQLNGENSPDSYRNMINPNINLITLLLYEGSIIMKCYISSMAYTCVNIPFLFFIIFKIVYIREFWKELTSIILLLPNVIIITFILLNIFITMKLDEWIVFSWSFVFW